MDISANNRQDAGAEIIIPTRSAYLITANIHNQDAEVTAAVAANRKKAEERRLQGTVPL